MLYILFLFTFWNVLDKQTFFTWFNPKKYIKQLIQLYTKNPMPNMKNGNVETNLPGHLLAKFIHAFTKIEYLYNFLATSWSPYIKQFSKVIPVSIFKTPETFSTSVFCTNYKTFSPS